jgi:RTX calcium-binding nonapeptide repeat (4 copies)
LLGNHQGENFIELTKATFASQSPRVALFVAADGDDTITGSKDNDFIFGDANNGVLRSMAANDNQVQSSRKAA